MQHRVSQRSGRAIMPVALLVVGFVFLMALGLLVPATLAAPPAEWPTLSFEPVVSDLQEITQVTHAGDGSGRLVILERPGRIRLLQDGALLPTPFLDITDRVSLTTFEQGMLGVAFPPEYASKGYFYVFYTNLDNRSVLSRFYVADGTPNQADPSSEERLLIVPQVSGHHYGGQIAV